jgi:hypothetical protein
MSLNVLIFKERNISILFKPLCQCYVQFKILIRIRLYLFKSVAVVMENNFWKIGIIVIINIFIMLFINLLLLHDCNYVVVEENLWKRKQ